MIKDLAIYGAGGFGREVALLIEQINEEKKQWNFVGFFDDGISSRADLPLIGKGESIKKISVPLAIVVAVADPFLRASIVSRIQNPNMTFPIIAHPRANLGSATNSIGRGTIITESVILTTGITLGEFVIVNLQSTIGHDAVISNFTSIMPGTNISGNVHIGAQTLIGTGAKILQNLTIGETARVGAGAVVTENVNSGQTVIGVPAKPLSKDA